jgi:hypothetical protein
MAPLLLQGCGSVNTWLAENTADKMPAWAGGLPADAPPRPSDPRYPEFERAMRERSVSDAKQPAAPNDQEPKKADPPK